jgi:hypothetical protein
MKRVSRWDTAAMIFGAAFAVGVVVGCIVMSWLGL